MHEARNWESELQSRACYSRVRSGRDTEMTSGPSADAWMKTVRWGVYTQ